MSIEYHDLGLVTSALEGEAPKKSSAIKRLAAAFVATSLSALMVPGCVADTASAPGTTWGLDNGTVGKASGPAEQPVRDCPSTGESAAA